MPDRNKKENRPNQSKVRSIDKITPEMDKIMDGIRFIESSDISGRRNAGGSSAYGYYQFMPGTVDLLNNKYGTKYTLNTREEQHEIQRLSLLETKNFLKTRSFPESKENYYVHHAVGNYTKTEKIIRALKNKPNAKLTEFLTKKEIDSNPGLFKDKDTKEVFTVSQMYNTVQNKYKDADNYYKKQPSEYNKKMQAEKWGIYNGTATPLDLRPGVYIDDGKAEWRENPNPEHFNGTKLGEQNNDFVLNSFGNIKKAILKGTKGTIDVDKSFNTNIFSNPYNNKSDSLDGDNSSSEAPIPAFMNDPSIQNFSTRPSSNLGLMGPEVGTINNRPTQDRQLSRAEILNSTARFANPDNPYTEAGNIEALLQYDEKGNPVALNDPKAMNINTDVLMNSNLGLSNQDMPPANSQRMMRNGGNLNETDMNRNRNNNRALEEGNDELISFNEGGTHNENPYGGIPQNTNPDGSLNTVEQGETKHLDYVYSDNLTVTPELAEELRLPKDVENKTFAEASKILNEVLEENPTDNIVKRTVNKQLDSLKIGNEKAKEDNKNIEQITRQAQFESENVDILNQLDEELSNQQNLNDINNMSEEELLLQNQMQGGNTPQFSEEDLNMFADGGNLDAGSIASGAIQLGSTLAFADDPYQEDKIDPGKSALSGLASGASIGTSILPGWGTAIGAVVGGVGGLVMGSSKAKKQEKILNQKEQERQGRALAPFKDPRSNSGFIEDREVFNNGGQMSNYDEDDFYLGDNPNNLPSYLKQLPQYDRSLNPNDLYANNPFMYPDNNSNIDYTSTLMDELLIDNTNNNANNNQPFSYNQESEDQYRNMVRGDSTTKSKTTQEDDEDDNNFRPRGENLLQYANILGSYQDMRSANAKQPYTEVYRASGNRMTPGRFDVNAMMNELRYAANTSDYILQNNASGNAGAARANILANRLNTNRAISEGMLRGQEFNLNQEQQALQYNNQLSQYVDSIYNEQTIANQQHIEALEAERRARRNDFFNNLSAFGREQSNRNAGYNLSGGFDRYGNKNSDMIGDLIKAIQKSRRNNNGQNT